MKSGLRTAGILAAAFALGPRALEATPIALPNPLVLKPGMALRIPFATHPAAWGDTPPNYLDLSLGGDGMFEPPAPQSSVINQLYDGERLLGTYVYPIETVLGAFTGRAFGGQWRSSSSVPFPWTIVDFRSILDGTIDGHIDIFVRSGKLTLFAYDHATADLNLFHMESEGGFGNASWISAGPAELVSIPEPGSCSQLVVCMLLVRLSVLARRRRHRP